MKNETLGILDRFKNLNNKDKLLIISIFLIGVASFFILISFLISNIQKIPKNSSTDSDSEDTISYPVVSYPETNTSEEIVTDVISYPSEGTLQEKSITYSVSGAVTQYDNGTKTLSKNQEPGDLFIILFSIENVNLNGTLCTAYLFTYNGVEKTLTETRSVLLSQTTSVTYQLPIGIYKVEFHCNFDNEDHVQTYNVNAIEAPPSVCDSVNVAANYTFKDLSDTQSGILGTWKGCTKNPWNKQYRVEFTFNSNGTYNSKNIEVIENPNTIRKNPATYYGDANMDNLIRNYALEEFNETDGVSGYMRLFTGNNPLGDLNSMKLSTDGQTLYFEIMRGEYGPMKFLLQKVQ